MPFTSVFDAISTNARTLPRGQHAGYTTGGGYIEWTTPQWQHDPGALRICQDPSGSDSTADVFDIESGGGSPSAAAGWARRARASFTNGTRPGQRPPCVYSAGGTLNAIANAIAGAKLGFPVYLWLAKPGISAAAAQAEILANTGGVLPMVGVQFAWPGYGFPSNGTYDESEFLNTWLTTQSGTQGQTVAIGNSGPAVLSAQKLLRQKDPALAVTADGLFGPGTQSAVETYQKLKGLTPDGVVGPATWSLLAAPVNVPPVKPPAPVPPPPPKPLPAPSHLHTAIVSAGSDVILSWAADGGKGYHVQIELLEPLKVPVVVMDTTVPSNQFERKGLNPKAKYRWRVAVNENPHTWTPWIGFNTP